MKKPRRVFPFNFSEKSFFFPVQCSFDLSQNKTLSEKCHYPSSVTMSYCGITGVHPPQIKGIPFIYLELQVHSVVGRAHFAL